MDGDTELMVIACTSLVAVGRVCVSSVAQSAKETCLSLQFLLFLPSSLSRGKRKQFEKVRTHGGSCSN